MKKNKKCPKCKSNNIVGFSGLSSFFKRTETNMNLLSVSPFCCVPKDTYVCCNCGYSEEWIREGDLETIQSYKGTKEDLTEQD